VEKVIKPTCIVSTNTSGIPIKDISAKFGPALKKRFLGTHFFNPPRYMKLMEIIPGEQTEKDVVDYMVKFSEEVLGKGVVICKDRPNFVGNRIGVFDLSDCIKIMLEKKLKIDEVDAIVGKALGHPGTAVFGTMDLVGIDVGFHVGKTSMTPFPMMKHAIRSRPSLTWKNDRQQMAGQQDQAGILQESQRCQRQVRQVDAGHRHNGIRSRRQTEV